MISTAPPVFGQLAAVADATRGRMLLLLEQHRLSVGEVCAVMQLPQSTVSRHLKVLVDEGWASVHSEGTSRLYRVAQLSGAARRIWEALRAEVAGTAAAKQDTERLVAVLEVRRDRSRAFFSAAAGDWERMRHELFGADTELLPLLALLEPGWIVGDLGCGTGRVARTVARFVERVVAVDASAGMLDAARASAPDNVDIREGGLEALPLADGELDVALLFLVLHYVVDPGRALQEAARALKAGGRVVVLDVMPHDREDMRQTMGHLWAGFTRVQMHEWLSAAGFGAIQQIAMPVDARARGPALFVIRAVKTSE